MHRLALKISRTFFPLFICSTALFSLSDEINWSGNLQSGQVHTNDRVLAKVNDCAITVCDIAKKLEGHLQHQNSGREITSQARFEFFTRYWPQVLRDCIDRELILADAKDRGVVATHGQVREEMEMLFGPDIIQTLEKMNLSYNEAFESVKKEITVRRMLLYRTHYPAQQQVGPKLVRQTYRDFVQAHKGGNKWVFRIVSVQDANAKSALNTADKLQKTIASCSNWPAAQTAIERLINIQGEQSDVRISEIYSQNDKDLSKTYRQTLENLEISNCSLPIPFTSSDNRMSYRLFYLIERENRPCPTLRESAARLREVLIEERAGEISQRYLSSLRDRFGVQLEQIEEGIPPNFTPFKLT